MGGFVEQGPDPAVAAFGDAAGVVDLARLIAARNKAEIGPEIARALEALGIIDGRREGERGELADAGDCHQAAARIGCSDHLLDVGVDRDHSREHGSDLTCTGLKKPVRARWASPRASLRSVLWVVSDFSAW